jgi:hypothetical protein
MRQSPDPQFARVELTGPPEHVATLVSLLGQEARILYDTSSPPDGRGDITRRIEVVTHHTPDAGDGVRVAVTLQAVLDIDSTVWPQVGTASAGLQEAVTSALGTVRGVDRADTRVVAVAAFPSPEEQ